MPDEIVHPGNHNSFNNYGVPAVWANDDNVFSIDWAQLRWKNHSSGNLSEDSLLSEKDCDGNKEWVPKNSLESCVEANGTWTPTINDDACGLIRTHMECVEQKGQWAYTEPGQGATSIDKRFFRLSEIAVIGDYLYAIENGIPILPSAPSSFIVMDVNCAE